MHLKEVNMTYCEHAWRALAYSWWSLKLCVVCVVHACFPFILTNYFSKSVIKMAQKIKDES